MIKSRIVVAGALLAAAGAVNAAGFSVTPTITSDYDYRGVSQTNPDQDDSIEPAFQLGATYAFDSGLYVGAWGSNVDFGTSKPDVELDYTVGFAGGDAAETFGYDIGVVYYTYPSVGEANTLEVYAGISKNWFSAKISYSDDVASSDQDGFYVEGNAAYPLPMDFALLAHLGRSFGDAAVSFSPKTTDYSIGVGKSFGNFATSLKYVDGSDGLNGRAIFTVSTTLPWAE